MTVRAALALGVGLALVATGPSKGAGRGGASDSFAAWTAAAESAVGYVLATPSLPTVHAPFTFALASLVAVAIVSVLIESRLTRRLRTTRIGGLYGP